MLIEKTLNPVLEDKVIEKTIKHKTDDAFVKTTPTAQNTAQVINRNFIIIIAVVVVVTTKIIILIMIIIGIIVVVIIIIIIIIVIIIINQDF